MKIKRKTDMKEVDYITKTYYAHAGWYIDIVEKSEEYEAWIYCEDHGIKMFMFGTPKDYLYEHFMENVIVNATDYAKIYAKEIIKTEMVELVNFNIKDYYE